MWNLWPLGRDHFKSQGHSLNIHVRGLLADASYQISVPCSFRHEEFFFMFSKYKPNMLKMWPIFGPRGIIWTKLEEIYYVMLPIKYQEISEKKIFYVFEI